MNLTLDDGHEYKVEHDYGTGRAIIDYQGALVIVTQISEHIWEDNGEPVRESEKAVFNALVQRRIDQGTTVTVTDPDGNVETFTDKDGQ